MFIPICQTARVQVTEIHNPVQYITPQLLDFLKVTANTENYSELRSIAMVVHVQFHCHKPTGCKLVDPSSKCSWLHVRLTAAVVSDAAQIAAGLVLVVSTGVE